jgi:4-hydroxyphenylpyruvate dioxygenase
MTEKIVTTQGVEFVEYAVRDLEVSSDLYEKMGFTCVGYRTEPARRSKLYMQGDIKIILTTGNSEKDPAFVFTQAHGDGVVNIGYRVPNANEAHKLAVQKGARNAHVHETVRGRDGAAWHRAAIQVYGDVRNTFVSYDVNSSGAGRLDDFFPEQRRPLDTLKGKYLQTVDHITVNVEKGKVDYWAKFYEDIFGFSLVRYFDIRTDKTGLISKAIRNPNGRVTMPFNEPTDSKSQIQEFIDTFHGPGVQHIAFHTPDIISCLEAMIKEGFEFLAVPDSYYEAIPKRVPNVTENMKELAKLGILVDGSPEGYLLQIFTHPVVGPFFFEFIQRKGDNGFGDGNFRALFEAIERDQIRRGVL